MNVCKLESIHCSTTTCTTLCFQAIMLRTDHGSTGVEWKWFSWKMLLCTTVLHRGLRWHTKYSWMFPWRSASKWGWCSQQLIKALLTFSIMGNKLGTSDMATSLMRIFSHLFISLDISKRDRPFSHQSSFTLGDRHQYNPIMPIQVCVYSFHYASVPALLFRSSLLLPYFRLFHLALWGITSCPHASAIS